MGLFSVNVKLPSRIWYLVVFGAVALAGALMPLTCAIRSAAELVGSIR